LQDRAWSLIDVQLARRHELVPRLVAVVEGYAAHERSLQEALASARGGTPAALLALREAYPQLKADTVYQGLFDELTSTENRIAGARDYFNETVTIVRDRTRTFPGVLLASAARDGRFGARELLVAGAEVSEPASPRR
jgi:LemA protein